MLTLNDGRSELWQWDTGRTLAVDADCSQVHFSNTVFGRSKDVDVIDGVAGIPDILLQTDKDLNVWAFVGTAENGYTKISKTFKVNRRNKPADYVFTPPEQTTLEQIKQKIDYLESIQDPDAIKNAVNDYLDQNPVESPVQSVNGKTGIVKLTANDVGAISQDDLQAATNEALAQAKASGDFDGPQGPAGPKGEKGDKGEQGIPGPAGSDATVTAENIRSALGYTPADSASLSGKQDKPIIKTVMDEIAVAGAQYYLGYQTDVSVVLPDDAEIGKMVTVSWYNGATAATLSITGTMLAFDYTPYANTRSEINALWDGLNWAVLGNEMAVVADA